MNKIKYKQVGLHYMKNLLQSKRNHQRSEKKNPTECEKILTNHVSDKELIPKIYKELIRLGASLVAQWLRIHLPMQGTWVQALVWENPTRRRATKPMRHNY